MEGQPYVSMIHNAGDEWGITIPGQTMGIQIGYKIYAKDTLGYWIVSSLYNLTVSDYEGPEVFVTRNPYEPLDFEEVSITAEITDMGKVCAVLLSYSTDDVKSWIDLPMVEYGPVWIERIPAQQPGTAVRYNVLACEESGK